MGKSAFLPAFFQRVCYCSVCALQDLSNFFFFHSFCPVDRQYQLQHLSSLHSDSSLGGQGYVCHSFPCGGCLPSTAMELAVGCEVRKRLHGLGIFLPISHSLGQIIFALSMGTWSGMDAAGSRSATAAAPGFQLIGLRSPEAMLKCNL